ncbi:MAG: LysR family transcriptional regulator [Acidimicrobiia bacterium]
MDLDLRLVAAFLAVAEEEHMGRAADRLAISQPGLSKQIRRLEGFLGVPLAERAGRGIRLTEAGRAFAAEGRALLQRAERAAVVTRQAARAEAGLVRIGFVPPMPAVLSERLGAFDNPVELRRVDWVTRSELLLSGEIDLCLLPLPIEAANLEYRVVHRESRVAGFAADHPLAAREEVSILELGDEPIVDLPTHREFWCVDPRPDGRSPVWGPMVHSVEEMLEIVAQGRAMCITSASVAEFYHRPGVAFVPVDDIPEAEVAVAWNPTHITRTSEEVRHILLGSRAVAEPGPLTPDPPPNRFRHRVLSARIVDRSL